MLPKLTVDPLILTKENEVVLVKRKFDPFAGYYALPGGFVEYGETAEEACVREALEETGLKVEIEKIIGVYSDPKRDPRGHVISIVFLCKQIGGELAKETKETKEAKSFARQELKKTRLAFDHEKILKDAGVI
ncbi:MAG: NUDIX hydrolase [Candidatus Aenigmarchaeota archaeon]|nr:NUDIX hydrolase [Candidatus Aenigmarchaeota archaeon]